MTLTRTGNILYRKERNIVTFAVTEPLLSTDWYRGLTRELRGQEVVLASHPHLAPRLKLGRAIPLLLLLLLPLLLGASVGIL